MALRLDLEQLLYKAQTEYLAIIELPGTTEMERAADLSLVIDLAEYALETDETERIQEAIDKFKTLNISANE